MPLDRFGEPEPKAPPASLQTEQALLAAILSNNQVLDRVAGVVAADDFADAAHRRIFEACLALFNRGLDANAVTLRRHFEGDHGLADVGGADYLARLSASAVVPINAKQYAETVADLALRRRLVNFGQELAARAYEQEVGGTAHDVATLGLAELTEVATAATRGAGGGPRDLADVGNSTMAEIEAAMVRRRGGRLVGLPTGIAEIDDALGGLMPGNLYVIAGRPGMGKTAAAEGIAWTVADLESHEAAKEGRRPRLTLFASGEMQAEQLLKREIARQLGVPLAKVVRGELADDQFAQAMDVARRLRDLPLRINDASATRPAAVFAQARSLKRRQGLALVVMDYLQLLDAMTVRGRDSNRAQDLGEITKASKAAAKDLGVPILLLSQLRRVDDEAGDVPRPTLAMLKDSGSIEQDADVVVLLHRLHYYLERSKPQQRANEGAEKYQARFADWQKRVELAEGRGEWIIGKERGGPARIVNVAWNGPRIEFHSLAGAPSGDEPADLWERG